MRHGNIYTASIAAVLSLAAAPSSLQAGGANAGAPLRPPAAITARAAARSTPAVPDATARAQGLVASALSVYTPPGCVPGVPFSDVTCSTGFDPWIEQFALDGITAGCGGGNYCPGSPVTRDQMAVFIEKAMRGTGSWPPHTVLVYHHPAGESGSNVNSGNELMNLVGAIPSAGPEAPSGSNPWLVKLGPGTYDLGSYTLSLPTWVSVEGSGMEETVITSTADSTGTMQMSGGIGTITRLTSENTGSSYGSYGIVWFNGRLVLDHALAFASGSATYQIGIYSSDSPVEMYDDSGAFALGGTALGIYTTGSQYHALTINNSIVEGLTNAISNAAGYEVDMAYDGVYDSALANYGAGVFKCIGNFDRNMSPVACP